MGKGVEVFLPIQFPEQGPLEPPGTFKAVDQVGSDEDTLMKGHQTIGTFGEVVIRQDLYIVPLSVMIA